MGERVAGKSLGAGHGGGREIDLQCSVPDQLWHLCVSTVVLVPRDSPGASCMV